MIGHGYHDLYNECRYVTVMRMDQSIVGVSKEELELYIERYVRKAD